MMDAFVDLTLAKLDLEGSIKECSWLQALFKVVLDNIYGSAYLKMSCEEICFKILDYLMLQNGNILPTDHVMLSVNDLFNYDISRAGFCGRIRGTAEVVDSLPEITGYSSLEEKFVTLIGFLTASPRSVTALISGSGLLYLEDKSTAVLCQVVQPEKELLNGLVVLSKWNFIPCQKFPVIIFEGATSQVGTHSKFGYVEVVEKCLCIGKEKLPSPVPSSLNVGDYAAKSELAHFNLRGILTALSPIHRSMRNRSKERPFFLAQFMCMRTQYSTVVVLQGEKFAHWHNFLIIGSSYVITNVFETTMNKDQTSERKVLAVTKNSDFYKDVLDENSPVEVFSFKVKRETTKVKRKGDDSAQKGTQVKIRKLKGKRPCCEKPTGSVNSYSAKSGVFWCSGPMSYQGALTAIINIEAGVYEIDGKIKLYIHFQPCSNFGCGLRVGTMLSLHNVHLCKLDQKVLGLCCCTYSTIRITQYSKLASPFKAFCPSMNRLYNICQNLSLVQFIHLLNIISVLLKKFKPSLSRTDIVGPKKISKSSSSPWPNLLSHVLNLESRPSSGFCYSYQEFFGYPHKCRVSVVSQKETMPKPETLEDILNAVERLRTHSKEKNTAIEKPEKDKTCCWKYKEISMHELPENTMLIGWLNCCSETGQLFLSDQTAKIACLIVEMKKMNTIHKCTKRCLHDRNETKPTIVAQPQTKTTCCPLVHPWHFGAILKVEYFKIVIESFNQQGLGCNQSDKSNEIFVRKIYLAFSLRQATVLGTISGLKCLRVSCNELDPKQNKKEDVEALTVSKNNQNRDVENEVNVLKNASRCCFLFFVKRKELLGLNSDDKCVALTSSIQGYFTGEFKQIDINNFSDNILDRYTKSVTLRFSNNCCALAFLHPGCLYYVTEKYQAGNMSRIKKALVTTELCPLIEMSSNITFEQVNRELVSHSIHQEWMKLSEECLEIKSVKECLSRGNKIGKNNDNSLYSKESGLLSFRGVIVHRNSALFDQSENSCLFSTIPRGQMYLAHYGLVSDTRARTLSLGGCYLGNRQLVLTIRDVETADTVKVYIDLSARSYPLGLVVSAVVTFHQVSRHVSRKGNVYVVFNACSDITVESFSPPIVLDERATNFILPTTGKTEQGDSYKADVRLIIDFTYAQNRSEVLNTVAYVLCRVTAVQKVAIRWICSKCNKLSNNCQCHTAGGDHVWMFSAQARCLVEDGTSEAMLYVDGEEVKNLLLVKDSVWKEVKDLSQKQGEVLYQRSAYWKSDATGDNSKADVVLSNISSSIHALRRIKIVCKQLGTAINKEAGHETRKLTVERNDHLTYILGRTTLRMLEMKEINSKEEAARLFNVNRMSA